VKHLPARDIVVVRLEPSWWRRAVRPAGQAALGFALVLLAWVVLVLVRSPTLETLAGMRRALLFALSLVVASSNMLSSLNRSRHSLALLILTTVIAATVPFLYDRG
jgi:hypothetical protein